MPYCSIPSGLCGCRGTRVVIIPPIPPHPSLRSRDGAAYFLRNEQPSVNRALPPVGWHRTWEQPAQTTTVWAWEKTVVMVKQPGHLTSMKKERGPGTRVCSAAESSQYGCCVLATKVDGWVDGGWLCGRRTFSLCLRASAAGLGLRRSTART